MEMYVYAFFLVPQPWHCGTVGERQVLLQRIADPPQYARYAARDTPQFVAIDDATRGLTLFAPPNRALLAVLVAASFGAGALLVHRLKLT
jgi:hypothetical protein